MSERVHVKETIMKRDSITAEEADELIAEFKKELNEAIAEGDFEHAHNLCGEHFGLEPDYLDEFIF